MSDLDSELAMHAEGDEAVTEERPGEARTPLMPTLGPVFPILDLLAYGPSRDEVLQALGLPEGKDAHGPANLRGY